ncbi:MAG: patatin [Gammaproteobacteria bacterium]|nr:patatin [Gammaproteobacteria bacterium]NIR85622.1 patatin [Gammaproteobacteria bacterium]NIR90110.1 patatin [Gammaproteobacteria bacterium]NIU06756.1 patatin [Gammaproteobacteria bacterium]NIV53689.1 patatin [Gammaproteobacteria bacterium]
MTNHKTRDQHLFDEGPKRILALDGGGIRGILTLQILRRIESILRERVDGHEGFRMCDYFDLIGGTSTGAIIAAALAMGYSVDDLDDIYRGLGEHVFRDELFRLGLFRAKFDVGPLREVLEREFEDVTLGDERVRTGLAIVTKRLDTGSAWILHNNPRGRYFGTRPGSTAVPNADYPLKNIVRASTAAPHYFDPERIPVAADTEGAFVDGGVSPHNDPSLQLLLLATLRGYGLHWPLGKDKLCLVSVGTGSWEPKLAADEVLDMPAAKLALRALSSLMGDAAALNQLLLQWLSTSRTARSIDREVGDLSDDVLGGGAPWLTYLRYDAQLDREWLKTVAGLDFSEREIEAVRKMDDPHDIEALVEIGQFVAATIDEQDFAAKFDL